MLPPQFHPPLSPHQSQADVSPVLPTSKTGSPINFLYALPGLRHFVTAMDNGLIHRLKGVIYPGLPGTFLPLSFCSCCSLHLERPPLFFVTGSDASSVKPAWISPVRTQRPLFWFPSSHCRMPVRLSHFAQGPQRHISTLLASSSWNTLLLVSRRTEAVPVLSLPWKL